MRNVLSRGSVYCLPAIILGIATATSGSLSAQDLLAAPPRPGLQSLDQQDALLLLQNAQSLESHPESPSRFPQATRGRELGIIALPKNFAAQNESRRKIDAIRKSIASANDEKEKEELKAELKTELEKEYDAYLSQLEEPLKQMEERLNRLRAEYDKRKSARDELVKLRLDSFWYEANGMSWPGDRGNNLIDRDLRWTTVPGVPAGLPRLPSAPSTANRPTVPFAPDGQ